MSLSGAKIIHLKKGVPASVLEVSTDEVTVGSDLRCTIRIHRHDIERKHCVIQRNGSKIILRNSAQSNNILVNDEPVTNVTELKHNDIITISNRNFMWNFDKNISRNKYRRVTTFLKHNTVLDEKFVRRTSLPLSSLKHNYEENAEKQVAIVKPLQQEDLSITDDFNVDSSGPSRPIYKSEKSPFGNKTVSKSTKRTSVVPAGVSSKLKSLGRFSCGAPLTRSNQRKKTTRHSLAAIVQTIKDSVKTKSKTTTPRTNSRTKRRGFIQDVKQQGSLSKQTAVKRKLSEEEVTHLNNKKRKLNSPTIDARKKAALMVLTVQPDRTAETSYPQHSFSLEIPDRFNFGPVANYLETKYSDNQYFENNESSGSMSSNSCEAMRNTSEVTRKKRYSVSSVVKSVKNGNRPSVSSFNTNELSLIKQNYKTRSYFNQRKSLGAIASGKKNESKVKNTSFHGNPSLKSNSLRRNSRKFIGTSDFQEDNKKLQASIRKDSLGLDNFMPDLFAEHNHSLGSKCGEFSKSMKNDEDDNFNDDVKKNIRNSSKRQTVGALPEKHSNKDFKEMNRSLPLLKKTSQKINLQRRSSRNEFCVNGTNNKYVNINNIFQSCSQGPKRKSLKTIGAGLNGSSCNNEIHSQDSQTIEDMNSGNKDKQQLEIKTSSDNTLSQCISRKSKMIFPDSETSCSNNTLANKDVSSLILNTSLFDSEIACEDINESQIIEEMTSGDKESEQQDAENIDLDNTLSQSPIKRKSNKILFASEIASENTFDLNSTLNNKILSSDDKESESQIEIKINLNETLSQPLSRPSIRKSVRKSSSHQNKNLINSEITDLDTLNNKDVHSDDKNNDSQIQIKANLSKTRMSIIRKSLRKANIHPNTSSIVSEISDQHTLDFVDTQTYGNSICEDQESKQVKVEMVNSLEHNFSNATSSKKSLGISSVIRNAITFDTEISGQDTLYLNNIQHNEILNSEEKVEVYTTNEDESELQIKDKTHLNKIKDNNASRTPIRKSLQKSSVIFNADSTFDTELAAQNTSNLNGTQDTFDEKENAQHLNNMLSQSSSRNEAIKNDNEVSSQHTLNLSNTQNEGFTSENESQVEINEREIADQDTLNLNNTESNENITSDKQQIAINTSLKHTLNQNSLRVPMKRSLRKSRASLCDSELGKQYTLNVNDTQINEIRTNESIIFNEFESGEYVIQNTSISKDVKTSKVLVSEEKKNEQCSSRELMTRKKSNGSLNNEIVKQDTLNSNRQGCSSNEIVSDIDINDKQDKIETVSSFQNCSNNLMQNFGIVLRRSMRIDKIPSKNETYNIHDNNKHMETIEKSSDVCTLNTITNRSTHSLTGHRGKRSSTPITVKNKSNLLENDSISCKSVENVNESDISLNNIVSCNVSSIEKEITPEAKSPNLAIDKIFYESTPLSTTKLKRNKLLRDENIEQNSKDLETSNKNVPKVNEENFSDEELVTPKTSGKIIPDVAKKLHSTAKKSILRRTFDSEKHLHPLSKIINKSLQSANKNKFEQFEELHNNSKLDKVELVNQVNSKTPTTLRTNRKRKSKVTFLNLSGIKQIFSSPKSAHNDLTDVEGVKYLFKQQKSHQDDLTNISGIRNMFSPKNSSQDNSQLNKNFTNSSFGGCTSTPLNIKTAEVDNHINILNSNKHASLRENSIINMKPMTRGRRLYSETDVHLVQQQLQNPVFHSEILEECDHPAITTHDISSRQHKRILDPIFKKLVNKQQNVIRKLKKNKSVKEICSEQKNINEKNSQTVIRKCSVVITPLKNIQNFTDLAMENNKQMVHNTEVQYIHKNNPNQDTTEVEFEGLTKRDNNLRFKTGEYDHKINRNIKRHSKTVAEAYENEVHTTSLHKENYTQVKDITGDERKSKKHSTMNDKEMVINLSNDTKIYEIVNSEEKENLQQIQVKISETISNSKRLKQIIDKDKLDIEENDSCSGIKGTSIKKLRNRNIDHKEIECETVRRSKRNVTKTELIKDRNKNDSEKTPVKKAKKVSNENAEEQECISKDVEKVISKIRTRRGNLKCDYDQKTELKQNIDDKNLIKSVSKTRKAIIENQIEPNSFVDESIINNTPKNQQIIDCIEKLQKKDSSSSKTEKIPMKRVRRQNEKMRQEESKDSKIIEASKKRTRKQNNTNEIIDLAKQEEKEMNQETDSESKIDKVPIMKTRKQKTLKDVSKTERCEPVPEIANDLKVEKSVKKRTRRQNKSNDEGIEMTEKEKIKINRENISDEIKAPMKRSRKRNKSTEDIAEQQASDSKIEEVPIKRTRKQNNTNKKIAEEIELEEIVTVREVVTSHLKIKAPMKRTRKVKANEKTVIAQHEEKYESQKSGTQRRGHRMRRNVTETNNKKEENETNVDARKPSVIQSKKVLLKKNEDYDEVEKEFFPQLRTRVNRNKEPENSEKLDKKKTKKRTR